MRRFDWVGAGLFLLLVALQTPIPWILFHNILVSLLCAGAFAIVYGVELRLLHQWSMRRWKKFYQQYGIRIEDK